MFLFRLPYSTSRIRTCGQRQATVFQRNLLREGKRDCWSRRNNQRLQYTYGTLGIQCLQVCADYGTVLPPFLELELWSVCGWGRSLCRSRYVHLKNFERRRLRCLGAPIYLHVDVKGARGGSQGQRTRRQIECQYVWSAFAAWSVTYSAYMIRSICIELEHSGKENVAVLYAVVPPRKWNTVLA